MSIRRSSRLQRKIGETSKNISLVNNCANDSEEEEESTEKKSSYFNRNSLNDLISGKTQCNLSDSDSDSSSDSHLKSSQLIHSPNHESVKLENQINFENAENESGFHEESTVSDYFDFTPILSSQADSLEETEKQESINVNTLKPSPKIQTKTSDGNVENIDVCQLLSLGENVKLSLKDIKSSVPENSRRNYEVPKQVEVLVKVPQNLKAKKTTDVERALKRRLNSVKQETQVYIHKTSLLCWIAHGNYVNSVLNNNEILSVALSLLPSDKSYPKKHTDLKYLEDFLNWFNKKVKLNKENNVSTSNTGLLLDKLKDNFEKLIVDSKRDLIFMFICILRAIGIKARLVINLNAISLKLTKSDLLPISASQTNEKLPKQTSSLTHKQNKQSSNTTVTDSNRIVQATNERMASTSKTSSSNIDNEDKKLIKEKSKYFRNELQKSDEMKNVEKTSKSSSSSISNRNKTLIKEKSRYFKDKLQKHDGTINIKKGNQNEESNYFKNVKKSSSATKTTNIENMPSKKMNLRTKKPKNESIKLNEEYIAEQMSISNDSDPEVKSTLKTNRSRNNSSKQSQKLQHKIECVKRRLKITVNKNLNKNTDSYSSSDSDMEFVLPSKKVIDRRVLSSEEESSASNKKEKPAYKTKTKNENYWTEVYLEAEESWISIDVFKGRYHCTEQLYNNASHPVRYVLAWNPDQTIKDVTRRYDPHWLTQTRKLRVSVDWWSKTIFPYKPTNTPQDREENEELDIKDIDQPLPTSISDYKSHPLYVLQRHLLKFEALYPSDTEPVGYVKSEPVFPRSCVHHLHGREMWIKEAKVVRIGQTPYKIVKGRPKRDKYGTESLERKDIELFGKWQIEDYIPPVAQDGIVPRNAFGNVDLYKDCMLPKGTAHLRVPGLLRVASKLHIDCAAAVVGFEFKNGFSYPIKDGFVVCEEYVDILIDAWNEEVQADIIKRKNAARDRAIKLWKKAFKLIRIQRKLKRKYNFNNLDAVTRDEPKRKIASTKKH